MPPRYTEFQAREAIAASRSLTEALRRLGMRPAGGNHATLRRYADEVWDIPTAHFDPDATRHRPHGGHARRLSEVLVEHSTYCRRSLKARLYREGVKEPRCELCGQGEQWNGRRMALILDHVNGIADDNRLENLQIVCPNCNATLDTHCARNLRRTVASRRCLLCGEPFRPRRKEQRYCSRACAQRQPSQRGPKPDGRRVERPPYEQLLHEVTRAGWEATGRRYGVSGNAVRKWMRAYEAGGPPAPG